MLRSVPRLLSLVPPLVSGEPPLAPGETPEVAGWDVRVVTVRPDGDVAAQLPDLQAARIDVVTLLVDTSLAGCAGWIGQVVDAVGSRPLVAVSRGPIEPGDVEQAVRAGAVDLVAADGSASLPRTLERELARASVGRDAGASTATADPLVEVASGAQHLGRPGGSDQRQMELALRESEERFRMLAEHSAEGIFVQRVRPTIGFEYLNPTMARMIGYPVEDLYADPELLRSRIRDDDRARMWASLGGGGLQHGDVEIDFAHHDGEVRRLRLRGTAIPDETGEIAVIHAVATDITREHREQEALRHAVEQQRQLNELKTGFVQAVSHELRTPLTSIVGFVELLLARDLGPEDRERFLRRIQSGATRLGRLVDDVLDLDRLDRPDAGLAEDEVDLAELARRVLDETTAADHRLHLDAEAATTVADDALLERVVDNLVRNALKHTPAGTNIWVRTRAPARIVVEDDGPGVPADLHERVFEPFQQGPGQQATHAPGTGIGLSLAQRIVRLHEGQIALTDRPGGGARFVVTLPAGRS